MSWRDLLVIVRQSPAGSALDRAMNPDTAQWGVGEYLLAQVVDNTNWLVWAKTEDATHNRNRPEPTPRPGVEPSSKPPSKAVSMDEARAALGWD